MAGIKNVKKIENAENGLTRSEAAKASKLVMTDKLGVLPFGPVTIQKHVTEKWAGFKLRHEDSNTLTFVSGADAEEAGLAEWQKTKNSEELLVPVVSHAGGRPSAQGYVWITEEEEEAVEA